MKKISSSIVSLSMKYSSKIRLVTFVVTLILFILAAGAPEATGSVGR